MSAVNTPKAPVWFIAHGGPPTLFEPDHGAHKHWLKVSKDIKQAQLKGIVFVSAHWQAEPGDFANASLRSSSTSLLMNTDTGNPLIYDFYNFPRHYYETQFASHNSVEMQQKVSGHLKAKGYQIVGTERGIDHGVWVPLRAAGDTLDVPLLQISLPIARDPLYDGIAALRLGKALRGLRDEGYAIIGGGQPVHNLRDYMRFRTGMGGVCKYSETFTTALTTALAKPGNRELTKEGDPARWNDAKALFLRSDYADAHPTSEHLLPVLVALGAAEEEEPGVEEFRLNDGLPLTWSMYRFG